MMSHHPRHAAPPAQDDRPPHTPSVGVVLLGAQILLHHGDVLADLCCWHTFFNTAPNVPRPEEGHGTLQGGSAMRIGRDTKRRVDDIKEEMEQPLRQLEMYLVRLNEHAGTKRMALPLENAVEKLRRWQREKHFTSRR